MKAVHWIDRVKAAHGWETDYRVAKELGVSQPALSRYRAHPESTMDDIVAAKVASALDIEPHIVILDQVAERTPVEAARVGFDKLLGRLMPKRKGPRLGGGSQVDITSAASTAPGGEPERQWAPALKTMACDPGELGPRQHKVHIVSTDPTPLQRMVQQLLQLGALIVPRRPFGVGGAS